MEEDKNYISMIHGDLTRAAQMQNGMPENIGVMSIKTANRTILEASQLPTPRALWDSFWYEGELSCLFADSNVGKSILAVQIASQVNCGKSTVSRIIQRSKEDRNAAVPGVPLSRPKENGTMGQHGTDGTSGTAGEARQAELFAGHEKEDKP